MPSDEYDVKQVLPGKMAQKGRYAQAQRGTGFQVINPLNTLTAPVSHQVKSLVIWQAECPGASNKGEEYLLWSCLD